MSIVSKDNALHPTSELRWLYIDFNSYFASVEQQLRPALRDRPVAVVPVETDSTCAIAASYEAKAYGVKTGTPIYEAKKMCPGLVCVLAQHDRYVEYHHRILDEVDHHIPVTAVCSIDEVACHLMDNETSPERITQIAHSIKRGLAANVGEFVKCSIGVAPNRYLAKVATDLQKPDGFTFISQQDLPAKLHVLKLRDLPGIGSNMERRLNMAGIYDMKALLDLGPQRMRKVWGSVLGERMWYLLRGYELPDEETTRSTIGHSHVMAPELREPSKAKYVARRLTLKAASRLRRMGYFASAFHLSVRIENGPRIEASEHCYRAQDSVTFLHLLDHAPDKAADYWRMHIATHPHFNPDCECLAVLLLNTRKRVKGHQLVSVGTMDTILVHPREVFRLAIIAAASAVIVMHNHPSGVIPHPVLCRM